MPNRRIQDDDVVLVRGNTMVHGPCFATEHGSVRAAVNILKRAPDTGQHPFLSALINILASPAVAAQPVEQEAVVERPVDERIVGATDVRDELVHADAKGGGPADRPAYPSTPTGADPKPTNAVTGTGELRPGSGAPAP